MKKTKFPFLTVCTVVLGLLYHSSTAQCFDVSVALDGSGDFTSVQAAIDAAPGDLTSPFVIYVADGVYDEKLFIEKNFITIIGESRDSTIITTAVLRRVWRETNPSDWGAATINVADDATDLTLAHLTIRNNFADVFPDFPDNNDHTFAIRGGGHRVIIIDCNVVTTGGDTLSLWNTAGGMFYHNNCFFEGWVDYVAPRGYCYITDCEFFGYNSNASIWHDGSGAEDHKLVIRNSHFDGVPGFALGRFHREAQFMLLDCEFSENMANKPIAQVTSDELMWGSRVYYSNCHRPFFDWTWFADNISEASEMPDPGEIDALWTFRGEWDPESLLDGLLPHAFLPSPAMSKGCVDTAVVLTWAAGNCVDRHLVYFGRDGQTELVAEVSDNMYDPGTLEHAQRYSWRVDEINMNGDTVRGEEWFFITETSDGRPSKVFSPEPADNSDYHTNVIRLDWEGPGCGIDSFYIYYGGDSNNLEFLAAVKYPAYFRQLDDPDSTYYWRVDGKSELGITRGDVWSFTLNPTTSSVRTLKRIDIALKAVPNPFDQNTALTFELPEPGTVSVYVFDHQGRCIASKEDIAFNAGRQSIPVDQLSSFPAGAYVCQIVYNGMIDTVALIRQ